MGDSIIPRASGIYRISCIPTGKFYIGSTGNLRLRWTQHQRNLNANRHINPHLQFSWNKHGSESFVFEVVEECDISLLIEREQHYLDTLQPFRSIGFNIALSADSPSRGRKATPESRAKMSASQKRRKHTPEHHAKIGEAHKGKTVSAEQRAKQSAAMTGRKHTPEARAKITAAGTGRKHSEESKVKMSAARSGKKLSPEHCVRMGASKRGIKQSPEVIAKRAAGLCKYIYTAISPDGEIFEFENLRQFCHDHDLLSPCMYNVVNGKSDNHRGWTVTRLPLAGISLRGKDVVSLCTATPPT